MGVDRRTFISQAAMGGASLWVPDLLVRRYGANEKLRIGLIGTGLRGQGHLDLLLRRADCLVPVFCDIDPVMIQRTLKIYREHGTEPEQIYTGTDQVWRDMLLREDLDAVIISTPWEWHVPMAVASLERNLYTGLEVGGARSVEECWDLVAAEEGSRGKLYFLENVCFRRDVMAILQMVRAGEFGELVHGQGGYQHDLREVKFNDGVQPYGGGLEYGERGFSEARWRTAHALHRNGDLYPTHGIGPLAVMMDINRGNRLVSLTSMASKSRGLADFIRNHPSGGPSHPHAGLAFALGDIVTTMIRCQNGETMLLQHDTSLPRPYSLGFRVQGTRGLWMEVHRAVHIEGQSPSHQWDDQSAWLDRYDHPLWQAHAHKAEGAGHGGMDWFLIHSFVSHARQGEHPPMDVYDAAVWRVITALSEQSIREGGTPQAIPDFTRGQWQRRHRAFGLSASY
jgi:predicted dehydrogenase